MRTDVRHLNIVYMMRLLGLEVSDAIKH